MTLILYTTVGVTDLDRSAAFYDAVFATIGYPRAPQADDNFPSWGPDYDGGVSFAICLPFDGQPPSAGNGTMVALRAGSEAEVMAFHAAALAHGGTSEGGRVKGHNIGHEEAGRPSALFARLLRGLCARS
jgi:catechol 2,3-dioxygenase-like lactoylglutathione lyase family enzyme